MKKIEERRTEEFLLLTCGGYEIPKIPRFSPNIFVVERIFKFHWDSKICLPSFFTQLTRIFGLCWSSIWTFLTLQIVLEATTKLRVERKNEEFPYYWKVCRLNPLTGNFKFVYEPIKRKSFVGCVLKKLDKYKSNTVSISTSTLLSTLTHEWLIWLI